MSVKATRLLFKCKGKLKVMCFVSISKNTHTYTNANTHTQLDQKDQTNILLTTKRLICVKVRSHHIHCCFEG